jgi:hypothetical protein
MKIWARFAVLVFALLPYGPAATADPIILKFV